MVAVSLGKGMFDTEQNGGKDTSLAKFGKLVGCQTGILYRKFTTGDRSVKVACDPVADQSRAALVKLLAKFRETVRFSDANTKYAAAKL